MVDDNSSGSKCIVTVATAQAEACVVTSHVEMQVGTNEDHFVRRTANAFVSRASEHWHRDDDRP